MLTGDSSSTCSARNLLRFCDRDKQYDVAKEKEHRPATGIEAADIKTQ
jgi:hypothetical protein